MFQQAGLRFPFVDRLNDGSTSFVFEEPLLISPNPLAIAGASALVSAYPGTFDPPCEGYGAVAYIPGQTYFNAWKDMDQLLGKPPSFAGKFNPVSSQPYSLEL
jgi:hypothetical protein